MKADWKQHCPLKANETNCGIGKGDKRLNIKKLKEGDLGQYVVWDRLWFHTCEGSALYDVSSADYFWDDCVDIIEECADGTVVCHEVKTETRTIGEEPSQEYKNDISRKSIDLVNMVNTKPYQLNPDDYEREADLYGTCNITVETYCSTQPDTEKAKRGDGWYKKLLRAVEDENNSGFKPKRYFWYYLLLGTNINIYSNGYGMPYINAESLLIRISADELIRIAGTPDNRWNGRREITVRPQNENDSERKILIIPLKEIWQPPEGGIKKYINDKKIESGVKGIQNHNYIIPTHPRTGTDAVLMSDYKGFGVAWYLSKKASKKK